MPAPDPKARLTVGLDNYLITGVRDVQRSGARVYLCAPKYLISK